MNSKSNEPLKERFISAGMTSKGLGILLAFSFVVTVLSFAVAYCEHKQYNELVIKYEDTVERISECEVSLAALMNNKNSIADTPTTQVTKVSETTQVTDTTDSIISQNTETYTEKTTTQSAAVTTQTTTKETTTNHKETSGSYYVTQSGKKYHIASCSYLSKSKIAISMDRIKSEGYSPCSRCIK